MGAVTWVPTQARGAESTGSTPAPEQGSGVVDAAATQPKRPVEAWIDTTLGSRPLQSAPPSGRSSWLPNVPRALPTIQ
jgi:hypothetical protein